MSLALYEPIKDLLTEKAMGENCETTPTWIKFASGALSGMTAQALANPTDLVKTRMQARPHWKSYKSASQHSFAIWNQGGVSGFYKGVQAAMIRAAIVNAAYLGSYDTVKTTMIDNEILKDGLEN